MLFELPSNHKFCFFQGQGKCFPGVGTNMDRYGIQQLIEFV